MFATAIAVIALAVSGYALYSTLRIRAALAEFASMEVEDEEEDAEDSEELWLADGELYAADKAALQEAVPAAVAFCTYEGVPCAVVPGQGVVSLHKLLSERQKPQAVKPHAV